MGGKEWDPAPVFAAVGGLAIWWFNNSPETWSSIITNEESNVVACSSGSTGTRAASPVSLGSAISIGEC